MSDIKWTAIENSYSGVKGQNKHVILVAYTSAGMGLNEVCAVAPMYDLRDMDLSGSVSWLEAGWDYVTKLWDPVYVFGLIKSANKGSCVTDAALQMKDPFLYQNSQISQLESIFKLRKEILTAVMIQGLIGPAIGPALGVASSGLAELMNIGGAAPFLIKTAFQTAINKAIMYAATH